MIRITKLFKEFTESEKSSGYILIFSTIVSLLLANIFLGESYTSLFHQYIGFDSDTVHLRLSIEHWVNDGLMAIFFFLVGLEIEREIYIGELSSLKNASLPVMAAIGGMLVPFLFHLVLNAGTATESGFGIPMATDIAFALGILSLKKKVPYGLKVFLTAFAIIDDLGAIIIIAIFYTTSFQAAYLFTALGIYGLLIVFNRLKIYHLWPYLTLGIVMWYCMLQSGVHATIAGVLLAFALPFGTGDAQSVSYRVQKALHLPVAFVVLPIFALVNTGIIIRSNWLEGLASSNSLGIMTGLVFGKPIGIVLFSLLAIRLKWSKLPTGVNWKYLISAGALGGIGFTMSIFISLLAFQDPDHIDQSKIAILISSLIASIVGLSLLSISSKKKIPVESGQTMPVIPKTDEGEG